MSVIIRGGNANNTLGIDADGNALVNLPSDPTKIGGVKMYDGLGNPIVTTENGAQYVSSDSLVFFEQVDGTALNTNVWGPSTSGMTIAQANGFITLNSGNATTGNAYAILSSIKNIPLYGILPVKVVINARIPVAAQANLTMELGIGSVATTAAPTDGCYFRFNPAGGFVAVINNGGNETVSALLTPPPTTEVAIFEIEIVEDRVRFYLEDVVVADIHVPLGQAFPTAAGRLPIFFRVYNSASAPSAAPSIAIGQIIVVQQDMLQNKAWSDVLVGMGRGAYQSPTAFTQTSNHTNSTSPASATLSNTAAGYTTLGGRYQFAAVGAAATDFALFAFQVPVGYQLFVTNVRISALNTGAAVGVSATVLDWALGINASAVSLATADGAGTWASRRIPLGMHGLAGLAAIGQAANDITARFDPPLVVDGGRFLHVILQVPIGLATVSQVIRGNVYIGGYFE